MGKGAGELVAVTGSTGFVGRHVCRMLVERGWKVRGLSRDRTKATRVLGQSGVQVIIGDVFDRQSMDQLLDGCSAVVHTIGIRREVPPDVTFSRLHPGATKVVVETALRQGVTRLVHISALGTRRAAPSAYHRSKFESELIVRRSALDWTILRPSLIHGHDGELIGMIRDWVLGRAAPRLFLPYFARVEIDRDNGLPRPRFVSAQIQPVHVDDVARAVARSLEKNAAVGEVYPIVGPDRLDWPTLLTAVRDAMPLTDKKKPVRPVPGLLACAMAKGAAAVGLAMALPFGESEPIMAMEDNVASLGKAATHLELAPSPFLASLHNYASKI